MWPMSRIESDMGRVFETLWRHSIDLYLLIREGYTNDQAIPLDGKGMARYLEMRGIP